MAVILREHKAKGLRHVGKRQRPPIDVIKRDSNMPSADYWAGWKMGDGL